MKQIVLAIACVAALGSGCGASDSSGNPEAQSGSRLATTVESDGVYEVGKDIAAGVYTAKGDCGAYSASTADFDILDDDADDDAYLTGSMPVGDVQRIELHKGEFFTSRSCSTWTLEDSTKSATADPATLAGACDILVGEGRAVQEALGFPRKKESSADETRRGQIQDRLFTVVVAGHKDLADPAGQLVDFLDDPEEYVEDGQLSPSVLRAFSDIRETCEGYTK